jgi:signal transduction histidine kinase
MANDKVNILLVDDRPENLLALEAVLETPGYHLVKAHSGQEALRYLLKLDFAVILIDVQMPVMNGFETVDLIKERERSRHTPVIFITALSKTDVFISRGYSAGAVDYILKPIVPEILRSKVAVFVDLFLKNREVERLNTDLARRALQLQSANIDLAREVEERKRSEEEVRRLNDQLELHVAARTEQLQLANKELQHEIAERTRLEKQKDEFIAVASHELRTPLTTVKGYTNLALRTVRDLGDERLTRLLTIASEKTDVLARLIDEMLDVSRIENNMLSLDCQSFDLVDLVKQIVSSMELVATDFDFHLSAPSHPVTVNADRQRIEQVITNLLENGIKYTGKGSPAEQEIDITVTTQDGEVITAVRDHGVGIPAEQQSQVFSRFFRASNVATSYYSYPGMGLGLFIAHNIIQRHHGRIWVDSVERDGSTFSFALPLEDAAPQTAAPRRKLLSDRAAQPF